MLLSEPRCTQRLLAQRSKAIRFVDGDRADAPIDAPEQSSKDLSRPKFDESGDPAGDEGLHTLCPTYARGELSAEIRTDLNCVI